MPEVFLLKKPIEMRHDGYVVTHTPFMISYDGRDLYAAFPDTAVAAYFMSALQLDKQYQCVPLVEIRPADLADAEYALVLRRKSEITDLLKGRVAPNSFAQNLLKVR